MCVCVCCKLGAYTAYKQKDQQRRTACKTTSFVVGYPAIISSDAKERKESKKKRSEDLRNNRVRGQDLDDGKAWHGEDRGDIHWAARGDEVVQPILRGWVQQRLVERGRHRGNLQARNPQKRGDDGHRCNRSPNIRTKLLELQVSPKSEKENSTS